MNDLSIFAFGDCMIRTLKKDDETWFVGRDVATALEYAKPENALATHVDNDKFLHKEMGAWHNYQLQQELPFLWGAYSV